MAITSSSDSIDELESQTQASSNSLEVELSDAQSDRAASKTLKEQKSGHCWGSHIAYCVSSLGLLTYMSSLAWVTSHEHSFLCMQQELGSALKHHDDVGCQGAGLREAIGHLIHFTCPITAGINNWTGADFSNSDGSGVAFHTRAVKIKREVSSYQCNETSQGSVFPKYHKVRSSTHINASAFHGIADASANSPLDVWRMADHRLSRNSMREACGADFDRNPQLPLKSETRFTNLLMAGSFNISQHIQALSVSTPVHITPGTYSLPNGLNGLRMLARQLDENSLTTCSPDAPTIGCLEVSYWQSSAVSQFSVLAKLGNRMPGAADLWNTAPWAVPANWMCTPDRRDDHIYLVMPGQHEAHEMIWTVHEQDFLEELPDRIFGVMCASLGVFFLLCPLQVVPVDLFSFCASMPTIRLVMDLWGDAASGSTWFRALFISAGLGASSVLMLIGILGCIIHTSPGLSTLLVVSVLIAYVSWKGLIVLLMDGRSQRRKYRSF